MRSEPYETETKNFLKRQNLFRTIYITWIEICDYCQFDYKQELADLKITDEWMINQAILKTRNYVKNLTPKGNPLDLKSNDEEILKIENNFLLNLKNHWSLKKILTSHIDFEFLTEKINQWSQTGPKNVNLFAVKPETGFGLDYFINKHGIWFTVYEPFIIPYLEIYYHEYDILPEWNFEDLLATDIIETFLLLEIQLENLIIIDLRDWMEKFDG